MFEHFTEPSRAVLAEAQDVAIELGSRYLDVGHLLYGCADTREETAGRPLRDAGITSTLIRQALPHGEEPHAGQIDPAALRALGIDYDGIREAVEQTFGSGALESAPDRRASAGRGRKPRFTPDAKRSLEQALRVALELHHKRIEPGHLLLGLLRLDDAFVSATIERSGATVAALSAAVLARLSAA
ncbi:ATP-dependent Clp protease ATP-binding subunit ClpC1 [mine drainage metagenome]|uniref:ATP-dependent Clp protease ATP-binding subunit ClpC1 n=1 Tax=mine drainage metagenome TaxID=410659 RepID=A0A1J5QQM9_9ZZZZ